MPAIPSLSCAYTVTIFFSTLIGSFLCIYSDASNFKSLRKKRLSISLFLTISPLSEQTLIGVISFEGLLGSLFYLFLDSCQLQYFFQLLPVVHQHFYLLQ